MQPTENIEHQPTVLVAEDDPGLRALVARVLRAAGFRVTEVSDGGRLLVALSRCLRGSEEPVPDVILSDIRMPIMNGLSMAAALRDTSCTSRVVLMTAFPSEETRQLAHRHGAALLAKPFTVASLLEAVRAHLAPAAALTT